jgi:formate hydrogenlyase subunit 3/multisubunit Na+/H+ antiporter MnhD subunit
MTQVLLTLFVSVAVVAGLYALALRLKPEWWAWAVLVVGLAAISQVVPHSWLGFVLSTASELAAVGLVWSRGTPEAARAARRYLLAVVLALVCITAALALTAKGEHMPAAPLDKLAVALMVVGFALKLGLVPVYFWVPAVARSSPAITTALIVAVVDIASFAELYALRGEAPWMFASYQGVWLALAVLSLLGGALLALAQSELKVMLAFSSVDDMGYLLIGLLTGGDAGLSGAWLGLVSHSVCKLLLFAAVGAAEQAIGRPVTLETRGLASRVPVASAAFMVGALAFLGVPPGIGFAGHWRLYLAGAELGGPVLLGAMALASALALLTYVRAIHRSWLGPCNLPQLARPAPHLAMAVLVVLAVAAVALGTVPGTLMPGAAVSVAAAG